MPNTVSVRPTRRFNVRLMDGEENDLRRGCDLANLVGGLDAVFLGHVDVEQDDSRV